MARKLKLSDLKNLAVPNGVVSDRFLREDPTPVNPRFSREDPTPVNPRFSRTTLPSRDKRMTALPFEPTLKDLLLEVELYDQMNRDSATYPTDIPMGNVRGTQNYPMDIPMGNMGRTSDLAAAQRQRDFQALVTGAPDMRAQRALDQQFYATDYRPSSGSSSSSADTSVIPPSQADIQSKTFGEIGGNLAPGNQNNGSTFQSPKYPNPVYGGYSVEALQELKANLAGTQNQRNLLTRNRAMDMDDLTRGYDKKVAAVPAGYNQKGLVDSGLVGRDVKRAGTDYGRSAGRIDMAFNDSLDTLFKKDDGYRRKAMDDSYKGFNADAERRAAMAPDIRSALG